MSLEYNRIEIFTREGARWHHAPLHEAVVKLVHDRKLAARVLVLRAIGGTFESGEIVSQHILDLSYYAPLKIEIILPAAELADVLPALEEMVQDGVIAVEEIPVVLHRTPKRLVPRHLRVRDVMSTDPITVGAEASVHEVVHLLAEHEFNAVPVVENGDVVGIISQGDLIDRAGMPLRIGLFADHDRLERERLLPFGMRRAREIMSSPVVTVSDDAPLERAIELMVARNLKRLPVLHKAGRLQGMLARIDVLNALAHHAPDWQRLAGQHVEVTGHVLVGDATLHDVPTVTPDTPLSTVLDLLDADSQRVAVLDADGGLAGLISDRHLLEALGGRHEGLVDYLRDSLTGGRRRAGRDHEHGLETLTASDVMRRDPWRIREDEPIDRALALMTEQRLKRLPVVTAEGKFVGVLSRDAMLRAGLTHNR